MKEIEHLLRQINGLYLVVIFGSAARGQEAKILCDNGKLRVFNDIDLFAVIDPSVFSHDENITLTSLVKDYFLTDKVDIEYLHKPFTKRQRETILYNDLIYSHKIIHGTNKLFDEYFGVVPSGIIRTTDVYNMFITRSWAIGYVLIAEHNFTEPVKELYQLSKIIIAAFDFVNLAEDKYISNLEDKLEKFKSSGYVKSMELSCDLQIFLREVCMIKQRPDLLIESYGKKLPGLSIAVIDLYLKSFFYFLNSRSNAGRLKFTVYAVFRGLYVLAKSGLTNRSIIQRSFLSVFLIYIMKNRIVTSNYIKGSIRMILD